MKRAESLSRLLIVAGIVIAVAAPLLLWLHTPLIHVSMAEDGGWNPDTLKAEVRKPLELHLTSDDVVHGFAVGQMDMGSVDVLPGKVTDLTLTFNKPGSYTFYCTRWCGLNHWRMRGTIEVSGSTSNEEKQSIPLYVTLGVDIDAPHEAPAVPSTRPSAVNGQLLAASSDLSSLSSTDFYKANSPYQVFEGLHYTSLNNSEKWDMVAALWQANTTSESLANGKRLYSQNCAACHGENGAGDGVFADDIAAAGEASMQTPANFTDPARMLGASPALLQGKILRGGMGSGMPMWGSIFTEERIWDLIAYIYSFQFDYEK